MPIRITGMNSGLDTESIITELAKAQKTKVESVKKKQTSLQWKQDAWKELNSKIYKLFNGTISNMRFQTDYSKKTTDISDSSVASIVTGDSSMNATQSLEITQLATTGYMTGDIIAGAASGSAKLTDAGIGVAEGSTISVKVGGAVTEIQITSGMTINGFVEELKKAGVEASYDEKNQRLHVAAKKSGKDNDFTITASNASGTDALKKMGILVYDETTKAQYKEYADLAKAENADAKQALIDAEVAKKLQSYVNQRTKLVKTQEEQQTALDESKTAFADKYDGEDVEAVLADKANLQSSIDSLKASIEAAGDSASDADKEELTKLEEKMKAVEAYEDKKEALEKTNQSISNVEQYLDMTDPANIVASQELKDVITTEVDEKIATAKDIYDNGVTASGAKKSIGKDAIIELNGITYEGSSNTFEINGLTITALKETTSAVTLTTRQDTEGIYKKIKDFLKEYNALINEMDKLYNADSAKGYDPLSDEEKDEMTDSEIEKWETKIKDSILRRDSNLSTVSTAMKNIMLQGATVNGKQLYLSNFGIETLGYFSAADNERNAYHINGDEDDSAVSSKENALKAAIAEDPETLVAFFAQLSENLYQELNNQSRSIEGSRSFGKFYDDKRMQEEYNNYTTKIKQQEAKLTALEERWYSKFSAMETALAKMQSNQSAVSSLLGGM